MNASEIRQAMQALLGRGMNLPQIEQLAQALVGQTVAAGYALVNEGDRPRGLMLLLQGQAEIFKRGPDGRRRSLGTIDAPTLVGEISLMTERPSSATVMAVTDCVGELLTRAQFKRLIASESLAAYKLVKIIAEVLAGRLAELDQKVTEIPGPGPL